MQHREHSFTSPAALHLSFYVVLSQPPSVIRLPCTERDTGLQKKKKKKKKKKKQLMGLACSLLGPAVCHGQLGEFW